MIDGDRAVRMVDVTLRDGSHPMDHQITAQHVADTVRALEAAKIDLIEVAHGDGLGGSSFNYGFSGTPELELIEAAVSATDEATIGCVLLPGVGTADLIDRVADLGVGFIRVATHCTEADIAIQHLQKAREKGLEAVGFLMLSHMGTPEKLVAQAKIMVDAGATCVYLADSAGAMLPEDARARVGALREALPAPVEVGFHAHDNLRLAIALSLTAVEAGATRIDGALAGLGAGAGNAALEALVAVFDRAGISTGADLLATLEAADAVVRPFMSYTPRADRSSIVLGHAGVYSSFLRHADRAAERYDVPVTAILQEVGRRQLVGGQEDIMIEIAVGLAAP